MARIALALVTVLLTFAPALAIIGENLIQQPTFDEGINGWDNLAGKRWEQQDDARPLNENLNPGCLEMLASDYVSQCIGIVGDEVYAIRFSMKTMLTGDAFGKAGMSVHWYSDAFCHNYLEGPYIHPFGYYFGAVDWYRGKLVGAAPLAAHSALVFLSGEKTAGTGDAEMRVRFDDIVVAPFYSDASTTTTTEPDTTTTTDEPGEPGCADPVVPYDTTTTSDALYILKTSVGSVSCQSCLCDTDSSGSTTTSDAQRALRRAVGQTVTTHCGACAG